GHWTDAMQCPLLTQSGHSRTHAAALRRSIAAAVNEFLAERRRPAETENQVRAMIGGGAKKPVEQAFGAPSEIIHGEVGVLQRLNVSCLLFLQSMSPVPQGAV